MKQLSILAQVTGLVEHNNLLSNRNFDQFNNFIYIQI